jgi:hypothetical protein
MSDHINTAFTPEQILESAQGNVNGLCLVAIAYLKEHNLSLDEFWSFVGHRLAPSWGQGASADEVASGAALNMVSGGCKLRLLSGDESKAEAVLAEWPPEGDLTFFGLTQQEADSVWGIFGPIAESLGYEYAWHRQGDQVTMTFTR